MSVFDDTARAGFAALYPEIAGKLTHDLTHHPAFTLDALAALAVRMRPEHVEYNSGDLPVGIDPDAIPPNDLSIGDTMRGIEHNGSWMVLKFVENDPEYRVILDALLDEIEPLVTPQTGAMLKREGFIFVSSPGSVTPFHFDPEHNVLLQLRGMKTMNVFPPDDESVCASIEHERFHKGGHRNLPWRDELSAKGRAVTLSPGDGIYVPVKTPHWVKNGATVSVSFSITWRSEWSFWEADARGLNHLLRRTGLSPSAPKRWPANNLAKSVAYRAINKMLPGR